MKPLLSIKNLHVNFSLENYEVKAVNGVDLDIYEGETLCLIGESGSGKSVLGLSILKLLPENTKIRGNILYNNKNILLLPEKELRKIRGKEIAWVPQSPSTSLNPILKVGYQVAEPMELHLNMDKKTAWNKVINLFDFFGIHPPDKRAEEYPHQFSGGMRQRALVAMGTSTKPKLIIADEPTKGVDLVKKTSIIKLFKQIKSDNDNLSLLLITHDIPFAKKLADRVAVMYCGQVVEISDAKTFFNEPLHPYSKALVRALPSKGLKPINGTTPSMVNPPKGCKFHPRCEFATEQCCNKEPPLIEHNGNFVRCYLYD